jgi:hypothetical protein
MTDSTESKHADAHSVESAPVWDPKDTAGLPRTGARARPGPGNGRAHSFRQTQEKRRSARKELVGELVVAVILLLAVYVVLTAKPLSSSSGDGSPWNPGPPGTRIAITLGTPAVGNLTCHAGGTAYTERIPWVNSSYPVTSSDTYLQLYEIWDGDNIADPSAVANVTASDVCAGAAPSTIFMWYVVLASANGTNLLTYTDHTGWTAVTNGSSNIPVENGDALVLVTYASLAGTGRGLKVEGSVGDSPIFGSIAL